MRRREQVRMVYILSGQCENSMPYRVLQGQAALGEVSTHGLMKMLVERCQHASNKI
jgi:hypothetical protein